MSDVTLVCFAVRQEAKPLFHWKLSAKRADIHVLVTGMGAHNAESASRRALHEVRPTQVFTCGFAGALNPEFQIADVLFDRETTPADFAARLQSAGAKPATFAFVERIAVTVSEKAALRADRSADAVEMESGMIQRVCAEARVPCVTLRAISDGATENLPLDFNTLITRNHKLSYARLFFAIMRSPRALPALVRLGKNSARAANQLAHVLGAVLAEAA